MGMFLIELDVAKIVLNRIFCYSVEYLDFSAFVAVVGNREIFR